MSGKFEHINEAAQHYATDEVDPQVNEDGDIMFLTPEESWKYFDEEAMYLFNMSGEEFLRRYDAGEFDDLMRGTGDEHSKVVEMVLMLPFAQRDP